MHGFNASELHLSGILVILAVYVFGFWPISVHHRRLVLFEENRYIDRDIYLLTPIIQNIYFYMDLFFFSGNVQMYKKKCTHLCMWFLIYFLSWYSYTVDTDASLSFSIKDENPTARRAWETERGRWKKDKVIEWGFLGKWLNSYSFLYRVIVNPIKGLPLEHSLSCYSTRG